jgi:hypothetical protein
MVPCIYLSIYPSSPVTDNTRSRDDDRADHDDERVSGNSFSTREHRLHQVSIFSCHFPVSLTFSFRYWGKRDPKLILPVNSTLSLTIDQQQLCSTTTSRADPSFQRDRLWLVGVESTIEPGGRLSTCISELKRLRADLVEAKSPDLPKVHSLRST